MQVALVSHRGAAAAAVATARSATSATPAAHVTVLDLDGSYRRATALHGPAGPERVLAPQDVGLTARALHRLAAVLDPEALVRAAQVPLLRHLLAEPDTTVLALAPGVLLLQAPDAVVRGARTDGLCLVARTAGLPRVDARHPDLHDLLADGGYAPTLLAVHGQQTDLLDLWQACALDPHGPGDRWLELAAATHRHATVRDPAALLGAATLRPEHRVTRSDDGTLLLDARPVVALDLAALDPSTPWVLDPLAADPRGRLSDHPVLAALVAAEAADRLPATTVPSPASTGAEAVPGSDLGTTSLGTPVDEVLRIAYREAGPEAPDPFDPAQADALHAWLTGPAADGGPGRWLLALHASRTDLRATFPRVPGADEPAFAAWVATHAVADGASPRLVAAAAHAAASRPRRPARPRPGVNVIGFLRGELGIGESARLVVGALRSAGVACSTTSVDGLSLSRRAAPDVDAAGLGEVFDTTVICVNADLTPTVAASVPELLDRSYRIGMWYWEVEDFPASQHGGFAEVDEVWVATDFVRRAVEPHAPVPVRTLTPPLPQRGPAPSLTRADLGLPERPVFLFSFDFLSTAERKNPLGLVEAFTRAFSPGEGPVLVVKSINAHQRPAEAERLRLRAAEHPDVLLMEENLDAVARDALVALCDCYVSLHRSEGLGLTMAEAMAWGKPVIATAYSGNLQFMTDENSFLVPSTQAEIPDGADPYPAGGAWAEPDLDEAARLMRLVVEHPEVAAARGARAALDIATLHTAAVAGGAMRDRLDELSAPRRARGRRLAPHLLRRRAQRIRHALS